MSRGFGSKDIAPGDLRVNPQFRGEEPVPDTMGQEVVDAMAELLGIPPDASSPPAADTTAAELEKALGVKPDPP